MIARPDSIGIGLQKFSHTFCIGVPFKFHRCRVGETEGSLDIVAGGGIEGGKHTAVAGIKAYHYRRSRAGIDGKLAVDRRGNDVLHGAVVEIYQTQIARAEIRDFAVDTKCSVVATRGERQECRDSRQPRRNFYENPVHFADFRKSLPVGRTFSHPTRYI